MRLIDADALLKQIDIDSVKIGPGQYGDEWRFMDTIYNAQTIDPVRHGRWLFTDTNICECSVCHTCEPYPFSEFEWCPNCGARLEGGMGDE